MDDSVAVLERHVTAGTVHNDEAKIAEPLLAELGSAGYWGLLVDKEFGGAGAPFSSFAPSITRMALVDPTVAGLASVHGCIGAVDPVRTFGSADQSNVSCRASPMARASARSPSPSRALAATSPLSAPPPASKAATFRQRREALHHQRRSWPHDRLVCLIEGRPAVLVVELPQQENENFQLRKYGLWALKHTYNRGIIFRDFRVPAENLLHAPRRRPHDRLPRPQPRPRRTLCQRRRHHAPDDGQHDPWAKFRKTYGAAIISRELVERRLGELAGLIVGCDALVAWCAGLIDRGFRARWNASSPRSSQRIPETRCHRILHEDPRRPILPPRPHVRR